VAVRDRSGGRGSAWWIFGVGSKRVWWWWEDAILT